jgi:hypothetical protein
MPIRLLGADRMATSDWPMIQLGKGLYPVFGDRCAMETRYAAKAAEAYDPGGDDGQGASSHNLDCGHF